MTQGVFSRNACPFKGRNFDVLCIYLLYMKQKSHPNAVQSKGYYSIILVAITMAAITMVTCFCPLSMFETHRGSRSLLPIITVHNVLQLHHVPCEELCTLPNEDLTYAADCALINHDNHAARILKEMYDFRHRNS